MNKVFFSLALVALTVPPAGWDWSLLPALLLTGAALLVSPVRRRELFRPEYFLLGLLSGLLLVQSIRAGTYLIGLALLPLFLALFLAVSRQIDSAFLKKALILVVLAQALLGIIGVALQNELLAVQVSGAWRAAGSSGYPLALIGIVSAPLPFLIHDLNKRLSPGPLLAGGLLLGAALLASPRAGTVMIAAALVTAVAFSGRRGLRAGLLLATAAAGLFLLLRRASSMAQGDSGFLHGREEDWFSGLVFLGQNPLGAGLGAWGRETSGAGLLVHSLPLEVAAAGGIIAGLLVLGLWALWAGQMTWDMLPVIVAGSALLLFDWAWAVPLVATCLVLAAILSAEFGKVGCQSKERAGSSP